MPGQLGEMYLVRRLHRSLLLVLAVAASVAVGPARAQAPAKRLAWVRMVAGAVEVRAAGNPSKPFEPLTQIGYSLFNGDTIRTGDDGRTIIQFTDGSRVYCFEETEFAVTEEKRARTVLGFEVERYTSRLIDVAHGSIGLAVEPNERLPTEVQSPTVVVGVRGTVIDPFQVNRTTGETRLGLKQGQAWGYTPDGQAAFKMAPGLLAHLGRDPKGRPTISTKVGRLRIITRDHRITLERGQGVFLHLKTAAGRAIVGTTPKSVGRVVVEAGGNRAQLAPRQTLQTRLDRKAGKLTIEALRGKVSITDQLGKKRLLVPGKPADLKFTPPAFEPRVIPGPKPRAGLPKRRSLPGAPHIKRKRTTPPALKRSGKATPAPAAPARTPTPPTGKRSRLPSPKPKPTPKRPLRKFRR